MADKDFIRLNQYYIAGMRPILRKHALYSDVSDNYISPAYPAPGEDVSTIPQQSNWEMSPLPTILKYT